MNSLCRLTVPIEKAKIVRSDMERTLFSGPLSVNHVCSKTIANSMDGLLPFLRTYPSKRIRRGTPKTRICIKEKAEERWSCIHEMHAATNPPRKNFRVRSISESPSDTVKSFYKCINDKNLSQLSSFFSDSCVVKDCSFFQPFQGKKEVVGFFEQLFLSMGQNVTFNVGYVCEDDEFKAGACWHLEWKKVRIPFTRGCTFFEFSKQGERFAIQEALVLIESPVKPGGLVLILLKIVTSLFDNFPETTEKFLRSHTSIVQWVLRIYAVFLAPFLKPIMKSYISLAGYSAKLFLHAINILLHIAKILFK